jgi:hypothetical protein
MEGLLVAAGAIVHAFGTKYITTYNGVLSAHIDFPLHGNSSLLADNGAISTYIGPFLPTIDPTSACSGSLSPTSM